MTNATPTSDYRDIEDVIVAHGLDHRRAMALLQIVECVSTLEGGVHNINAALWHLRRMRADTGLRINASGTVPANPDLAARIDYEAVAAAYGITDPYLKDALLYLIPDPMEFSSVTTLTDDLNHAIAALEDYIAAYSPADDTAEKGGA